MPELTITPSEKLYILRRRAKLTQAEAALKKGLSLTAYGKMERAEVTVLLGLPENFTLTPQEEFIVLRRRRKDTQAKVAKQMKCSRRLVGMMETKQDINYIQLMDFWNGSTTR